MSDIDPDLSQIDVNDDLNTNAAREGIDTDPLAEIEASVRAGDENRGYDLLTVFMADRVQNGLKPSTQHSYTTCFDQWRDFMASEDGGGGRNPACPSQDHARRFITRLLNDDGNAPKTVRRKVNTLASAFRWFAGRERLSHPAEYNPLAQALDNYKFPDENGEDGHNGRGSRIPDLTRGDLREALGKVEHTRDRAIVMMGLKTGMRAGEVANVQLQDFHIPNDDVLGHYAEMATNPQLEDHEGALVVPADRPGNKSRVKRIIPIDDDLRRALIDYLLIRPDGGEPWLFLSKRHHGPLGKRSNKPNDGVAIAEVWNSYFWPHLPAEKPEGLAAHYARHFFTTWFEAETPLTPAQIDYLRGDRQGDDENPRSADVYTNPGYSNVKEDYLTHIYDLTP